MSVELIVMDTKLFTKHWSFEIVHESRLLETGNLLTYWHDALVGISPHMTQPITTNRHLCRRSERPFFLSGVYSEFIPPIMPVYLSASYSEDNPRFAVAKTLLFLVPEITQDSRDNSSFKNRALVKCDYMWFYFILITL